MSREQREIKFRYTFKRKSDSHIWQEIVPIECLEGRGDKPFVLNYDMAAWELIARDCFTGLYDKNKNPIYEGDVLQIKTQSGRIENFIVEWGIHRRHMASGWEVDIPSFAFVSAEKFPTFPIVNNYMNGHDLDIIEIIGNIHQNPELISK